MARIPTREITEARLKRWAEKLAKHNATPILLVGVGHEHFSGDLVFCTLEAEEMDTRMIVAILRKAIVKLQRPEG